MVQEDRGAYLELTRFRGHLFFGTGGVHHAQTLPPVPGGIPGTDDRTPCARPSSPRLNVNCSRAGNSIRMDKPGRRCSPSSKTGTTRTDVTAASRIDHRSFTNRFIPNKVERPRTASCPPPASVVAVAGHPPAGRGQLATSRQTEETRPRRVQLLNRPLDRVIRNPSLWAAGGVNCAQDWLRARIPH